MPPAVVAALVAAGGGLAQGGISAIAQGNKNKQEEKMTTINRAPDNLGSFGEAMAQDPSLMPNLTLKKRPMIYNQGY